MSRRISLRKRKSTKTAASTKKTGKSFALKKLKVNFRSLKLWTSVMLVAGVAVLGAGIYVWYNNIFTDEDRIFYGMIEKSLETDSITRQVAQNQSTRTENQDYYLTFTPTPLVQTQSTIEQIDQTRQKSVVSTETIGTKDADYVQYTDIILPSNSADKTDYSKVLDTWAKRSANSQTGQSAQFLNEAIFTFIPFGNFNQQQKTELMQLIKEKEVYRFGKTNLKDGNITYENGRPLYTTTVAIKPRGLVEVLRKYAELTGIGDMAILDPSQYDDRYSFSMTVQIDMLSRHLRQINYPGEQRTEAYLSYGLNRNIELPETSISIEELQAKLQ